MSVKTVAIFHNREKPKAVKEFPRLAAWLKKRKITVFSGNQAAQRVSQAQLAIALGGDGTMLRVMRLAAPANVPVMGVNLGSLGFLAEVDFEELYRVLPQVLEGAALLEKRLMLRISVQRQGASKSRQYTALNDCVVRSGSLARLVAVDAEVNGEFLATYRGDGLIVATPTGSTAYSLAVSGPLVEPSLQVFLLCPISPHSFSQRPLIVSADKKITLTVRHVTSDNQIMLSNDGQTGVVLKPGDSVSITKSLHWCHLVRHPQRSFYRLLRTKLGWAER